MLTLGRSVEAMNLDPILVTVTMVLSLLLVPAEVLSPGYYGRQVTVTYAKYFGKSGTML